MGCPDRPPFARNKDWRSRRGAWLARLWNLQAVLAVDLSGWGVEADEVDSGAHFRRGGAGIDALPEAGAGGTDHFQAIGRPGRETGKVRLQGQGRARGRLNLDTGPA